MSGSKRRRAASKPLGDLNAAARTLSGMLALAVHDAQQRQQELADGGADTAGINRELKELTGVLKDIAGVVKALETNTEEETKSGVVLLPEVVRDESGQP